MIEEQALVVKVDQRRVWVASAQNGGCSGCAQKAGCSTQVLANLLKNKPVNVEVDSYEHLQVGDTVVVAIDEHLLLLATLLMYLFPLIALFTGGSLMEWLLPDNSHRTDAWVAGGAFTGLLLALVSIKQMQHLFLFGFYTRPVVVKKL